ncbi:starch synthase 1, chloroplastic/amyloplastic-like [Triticum urartu]|uniref:starch synthase 1, chloroplastic/amyloplastic-like n=1 Tax=Triticum urartu TaxID=4572 RepID=UPI002043170A|nr:starch synthase 1, chloroplastic/amyloplastic-like [Triticum urartu]XP_048562660.1 starch synthase 1, chloroplastic/amyloplastic-like [Triticum urartu]
MPAAALPPPVLLPQQREASREPRRAPSGAFHRPSQPPPPASFCFLRVLQMAATGVGAGCLAPSVRLCADPATAARASACVVRTRLRRVARGRYVAELSREGPAARPAQQQQQLAPPVVPGFLAPPPPMPAQSPAPTQPPLPDGGVGELAPDLLLEGIAEDSIDNIIVAASERLVFLHVLLLEL